MTTAPNDLHEWWQDPANLAELLEWLEQADGFSTDRRSMLAEIVDILEKPWHWTSEFREMLAEKADAARRAAGIRRVAERDIEADPELALLLEGSVAIARGAKGRL